jgi:three-Cys-motif partner protein
LGEYPKPRLLFLNSYDPDPEICRTHVKILKKAITDLADDYPNIPEITVYCSKEIHEATEIALSYLNKDFPSVWILDPQHPDHLPWEIVEKIGSTLGTPFTDKSGKTQQKKPELIINLMTSTLQRTLSNRPDILSRALGIDEEIWRPKYQEYEEKWKSLGVEQCTRHVILDLYADRLMNLYHNPPHIALVNAAGGGVVGGVVYTMLLCTDNPAGYHMMQKRMAEFHEYKLYEWSRDVYRIKNPDQTDVTKWF